MKARVSRGVLFAALQFAVHDRHLHAGVAAEEGDDVQGTDERDERIGVGLHNLDVHNDAVAKGGH